MKRDPRLLSRLEVAELLGCDEDFLLYLEREDVLEPAAGGYSRPQVERLRVCWSLHHQLGVNAAGLSVALHLLDLLAEERAFRQALLERLRDWAREG